MLKEFQLRRFLWIALLAVITWMISEHFDHTSGLRKSFWITPGLLIAATLRYGNIYALTVLPCFVMARAIQPHWILPPWAAVSIGCVVVLHALSGAWFIRRFLGNITTLPTSPKRIIAFLILASVPNGLISACLGILVFTTASVFTWSEALHPFLTWCIGPIGGTLVGVSCFLVLWDKTKSLRHKTVVILPIVAAIIALGIIYRTADDYYQADRDYVRAQRVTRIENTFESELRALTAVIPWVARLVESVPDITQQQFQTLASPVVADLPSVMAISYEPRVLDRDRAAYEQYLSSIWGRPITIWDAVGKAERTTAPIREDYFPLTLTGSAGIRDAVQGMDVGGGPIRRAAILRARDEGALAVTEPTSLVVDQDRMRHIIAFYPVFDGGNYTTVDERRAHHRGTISAVIHIEGWLRQTLATIAPFQLLEIRDLDLPADSAPLFNNLTTESHRLEVAATIPLDYFGRHWQLRLYEGNEPGVQLDGAIRQRLLLILQALLLTLTCAFVLMAVGHASAIEELYKQADRHQKLQQSRTTAILESIVDGVAKVDDQGRVVWVNSAATYMVKQNREKLLGAKVIDLIAPHDREAVQRALELVISKGEMQQLGRDQPLRLTSGANETLPIELVLSPFKTPDGQHRYVAVLRDVTERLQREQAQIERTVALRSQENKDQFLTIMGHELRTPLNAIIGYAELLSEDDDKLSSDQRRQQIEHISHAGHSLLNLVNNILKVAQANSGTSGVKPIDFELRDLCEEIEQSGSMVIRTPDHTLTVRGSTTNVFRTDMSRLHETIMHMVDNAAKFTPKGAIEVEVAQGERSGRPWLEIAVRDVGVGIEPQHLGHIFEPFYQADGSNTRKFEGAGVGLYLCKMYVQSLGGEIEVDSEPGKGSVFTVRVPRL